MAIAPPIACLFWLPIFFGATCLTLSLGLGYGLPISLRLIASFELCQLVNFGYSTYSLPVIHVIVLLKVLLSPTLSHLVICLLPPCGYHLFHDLLLVMPLSKFHRVIVFILAITLHLLSHAGWINLHAYGLMTISCHALKLFFSLHFNELWLFVGRHSHSLKINALHSGKLP